MITQKNQIDVKILLSEEIIFPILGKDNYGPILYLPKPIISDDEFISFQNMRFSNSPDSKCAIACLFKASVCHLSAHVAISDFSLYEHWAKGKDINLAIFIASLIEDAKVNAYLRALWPGLLPDVAYANAVSHLRLRPVNSIINPSTRLMAAVLSYFTVGRVKGSLNGNEQRDFKAIVSILRDIENLTHKKFIIKKYVFSEHGEEAKDQVNAQLAAPDVFIHYADKIYGKLSHYGNSTEIPALLYTDSHGRTSIYELSPLTNINEAKVFYADACIALGKERETISAYIESSPFYPTREEDSILFSTLIQEQNMQKRILKVYAPLLKGKHLLGVEFPKEDYTEYLRIRAKLSGAIRRTLDYLRNVKDVLDEDFRQQSGFLDLQEALQVVANKAMRSDVFTREEVIRKNDAWAIVIDSSQSLSTIPGEVKGVAVCMAEISKDLITNPMGWGLFAFNDKFYVVKDFSETYNRSIRARIGGLIKGGVTYLPDALNIAAEMLKSLSEDVKVIVVISDGVPLGYYGIETEMAETLKRIERAGITVMAIGVKSRQIRNHFKKSCVVETPSDIMKAFVKAYLEYSPVA
jgi:hypothetical protein